MPPHASTRAAINNEATRWGQQTQQGHHGMNLATLDKMAPCGGGGGVVVFGGVWCGGGGGGGVVVMWWWWWWWGGGGGGGSVLLRQTRLIDHNKPWDTLRCWQADFGPRVLSEAGSEPSPPRLPRGHDEKGQPHQHPRTNQRKTVLVSVVAPAWHLRRKVTLHTFRMSPIAARAA